MSRIYRSIYKYNTRQNIVGKDIHHLNLNHNDNRLTNLIALDKQVHKRLHQFFLTCERLDILEKFKKDHVIKYYSKSNYTAVKDRWINVENYIKRFDIMQLRQQIIQETPILMQELDKAIKIRDKHLIIKF